MLVIISQNPRATLNNDKLHNLYASPNIITVITSRRMRLVGHVARMEAMNTKFLSENLRGRDYSEDLRVIGKIILRRILG